MRTYNIMIICALVVICLGCSSLKNNVAASSSAECPVCVEKECPRQECPKRECAQATCPKCESVIAVNSRIAVTGNIKIGAVDLEALMDAPAILAIMKQIETSPEGKAFVKLQESTKAVSKKQMEIAQNRVNLKAQTYLYQAYAKINKTITDNFKDEYELIFDNNGGLIYPDYTAKNNRIAETIIERIILKGEDFAVKDITSDVADKLQ